MLIEPTNPDIPIYRQCQLLGVPKSSYYYKPAGESQYNSSILRCSPNDDIPEIIRASSQPQEGREADEEDGAGRGCSQKESL